MLAQLNGFFGIVEQMRAVDTPASSRCTRRCRRCRTVALRLRDDVVTEADERERQPAQRAGGRGRPVPGAEGDRVSVRLHELGVAELAQALAAREVSSVELTKHLLARIAAHHELGAFLHVDARGALRRPRAADAQRAHGDAPARCSACRSRTRTSSSPPTCRPPPARRCWPATQPVRRDRGGQARRTAGAVSARQAELRRVRDGLGQRELGLRRGAQPVGRGARAGRLVGRLGGRGGGAPACRPPPAPTPAARSASRPASAASPASSRPTACARATA